jgi:hypothetical protein
LICEGLYREGIVLTRTNRFDDASFCLTLSNDIAEKLGNPVALARALSRLAVVHHALRKHDLCKNQLNAAWQIFRDNGRLREVARIEYWRAREAWGIGDLNNCRRFFHRSLDLYREVGDIRGQADVLSWLSRCEWTEATKRNSKQRRRQRKLSWHDRGERTVPRTINDRLQQALHYAETARVYAALVGGRAPSTQIAMMLGLTLLCAEGVSPKRRKLGMEILQCASRDLAYEGDQWWGAWLLAEMALQLARCPDDRDKARRVASLLAVNAEEIRGLAQAEGQPKFCLEIDDHRWMNKDEWWERPLSELAEETASHAQGDKFFNVACLGIEALFTCGSAVDSQPSN